MKHLIIVDKKKFSRFIIILTLVLSLIFAAIINVLSHKPAYGQRDEKTSTIIIRAGETVWSTAQPIAMAEGLDTRDVVRDIYRLNDMENGRVQAGDRLLIPDYSQE